MDIEKKVWPEFFNELSRGAKTFELRLNDFDVNEGDTLVLKEWSPVTKTYTGRVLSKRVGYVGKWKISELARFWPKAEIENKGIQIISLKN
jgi:hypothetical protein